MALGFCGLSAAQMDAMTPCELQWRIEADLARDRRQLERTAQLACWVINPWIKQPLQVSDLIGHPVQTAED